MKEKQLTEHFKLSEMCKTSTGISNDPTPEAINNLHKLCAQYLEPVRTMLNTPIIVNSGFRNPQVNKAVGGTKNSYHLKGLAADIRVANDNIALLVMTLCLVTNEEKSHIRNKLSELYYDRGRQFVHIAVQDPSQPKNKIYLDIRQ